MASSASDGGPLVHLDLKGAPPAERFLLDAWLPFAAGRGAGGVLVEYEDRLRFPSQPGLAAPDAWGADRVAAFLGRAAELGLQVIPLLQTLGHVEYVLKHLNMIHLRELHNRPECLDVSDSLRGEDSLVMLLLSGLLGDLLALHPDCPAVHVGGDEVWHLAKGPKSVKVLQENPSLTPEKLYLKHLEAVCAIVWRLRPGIKILFWDDMVRKMEPEVLEEFGPLLSRLTPVVWQYTPEITLPPDIWQRYGRVFPSVLLAGAFKGASSSRGQVVPVDRHVANTLEWVRIKSALDSSQEKVPRVEGFILTGWQRFDHFACLCELLPAASPSLQCCLMAWKQGKFDQEDSEKVAQELMMDEPRWEAAKKPEVFPGAALYFALLNWKRYEEKYLSFVDGDYVKTWCSDWNISSGRVSHLHLGEIRAACEALFSEASEVGGTVSLSLTRYFDWAVMMEWMTCFMCDKYNRLSELKEKTLVKDLSELCHIQHAKTVPK